MLNWIKRLYNKYFNKVEIECGACCELKIKYSREDLFKMLEYKSYPNVEYRNEYDPNKPTILIMDDIIDTYSLYEIDFNKIKIKYKQDIFNAYNVVTALGAEAGFIAYKYIMEGNRVDYAILDITIGSIVKFDNGEFLDIDGVDIGLCILKNTSAKVLFSTAHSLNRKNLVMEYYITKFEEYQGDDISKFAISKNSDRVEPIYTFLQTK